MSVEPFLRAWYRSKPGPSNLYETMSTGICAMASPLRKMSTSRYPMPVMTVS